MTSKCFDDKRFMARVLRRGQAGGQPQYYNPCKRKQLSGEKEKKQNAKQVRKRNRKVCLHGQGRRETEEMRVDYQWQILYRSQRGWGLKYPWDFPKRVTMTLENMVSAGCCQWPYTTQVSHGAGHEDNDNWLLHTWQHNGESRLCRGKMEVWMHPSES